MTLRIRQSHLIVTAQFSSYVCIMQKSRVELSAFGTKCAFICLQIKFLDIRELLKKMSLFYDLSYVAGIIFETRHIYF